MGNTTTLGATRLLLGAVACGRVGFNAAGDAAPDAPPVLPPGAITWWRVDEGAGMTVHDSIGTATGGLSAGPTGLPTWVAGHLGSGLQFTGNGDTVQFGAPVAALDNLPALSIAAWVQPNGLVELDECIVDHGNAGVGWYFAFSHAVVGDLSFIGIFPTNAATRSSPAGVVPTGTWTHVIATWDGGALGTGIHLYANGVELAYSASTDGAGTRANDSTNGLSLNCSNGGMSGFGGVIDDVRVWTRVLSPSEAQALYELTK